MRDMGVRRCVGWFIAAVAAAMAAWPAAGRAQAPAQGQPGALAQAQTSPAGTVLLTERHAWRKFYMIVPPAYEDTTTKPADAPKPKLDGLYGSLLAAPPPADWAKPDFDDSGWLVQRGRQFTWRIRLPLPTSEGPPPETTSVYHRGTDPFFPPVGLICQRAEFEVADPKGVGPLSLSLTYRGGFVAYVNGVEVARADLPAGAIEPTTPAGVYPHQAFFTPDSLAKGQAQPVTEGGPNAPAWAARERKHQCQIPPNRLRAGRNVLAIEFHRSIFPPQCRRAGPVFCPAGLSLLELRASAGPLPAGPIRDGSVIDAWSTDTVMPLTDESLRPPGKPGPVRITACRNGLFWGQLAVHHPEGIGQFGGLIAPLTGPEGAAPLPRPVVCYAAPNPLWKDKGLKWTDTCARPDGPLGQRLDLLVNELPTCKTAAVWVGVRVPRDARPGRYVGTLKTSMMRPRGGQAGASTPVEVDVADWTLPDVADYAGLMNVYQSPETLAAYYKVPLWSDQHWKLIDQSMQLMAGMGNVGIFIPLLAESVMGNEQSMVVWDRQADGSYRYDFSVFDKYLATALKHHAPRRLKFISLSVWGYESSNRTWKGPREYSSFYGSRVTVRDGGKTESMKLPQYGTPECGALWRPLLLELKQRLAAKGLGDRILLGLPADMGPDPPTAAMFHDILPEAGWIAESHLLNKGYVYDVATKAMAPVKYNSIVYNGDVPDPVAQRLYGWQQRPDALVMNFNRSGSAMLMMYYPPAWSFRAWMEMTLAAGRNGNGRLGGDYWRMGVKLTGEGPAGWGPEGGSGGSMFGRFLHSHADESGLGRSCTDLFGPGPDGPVTTIRCENTREGMQEAEARAFIEKALLDRTRPPPPELAARAWALLDERTHVVRLWKLGGWDVAPQGWRERNARLFALAAEVAQSMAKSEARMANL